jgi:hypothetical protein
MIKAVEIVTITKLIPIFKEGQEANAIQVAKFSFEDGGECGFNVIAQRGLYEIGSKAVYIQPDFCLTENELFSSFISPGGNPNKSRLGKQNRVRAIKFNFSFEGSIDPIYSNGILMPLEEVEKFISNKNDNYCFYSDLPSPSAYADFDLVEELGVTKYEEPEVGGSGLSEGDFPSFMYKTDEQNINNIVDYVKKIIAEGQNEFGISIKRDGSSHTTYFKKEGDDYKSGVCSRSQEKKLEQQIAVAYNSVNGDKYRKHYDKESSTKGWICEATNHFVTDEYAVENLLPVMELVKDSWVELAKSSGLLEKGLAYCKEYGLELAFRGEIIGQGLKGSGNKLNPDSKEKQKLVLFGIDDLSEGYSKRINYSSPHNLRDVAKIIGVEYTPVYTAKFNTYESLCEYCDGLIAKEKAEGRVIEGVVIRTMYTNVLSCKYMNNHYDSNK